MKLSLPLAFVFAAACLAAGCASKVIQPAPPARVPGNPAAYLDAVLGAAGMPTDVSGFVKMRITAQGRSHQSRNVFFVKRSGRIRIETLGFLSRPALMFTADEARMHLYSVDNNAYFSGEPTAENLSRIIGIRLEPHQIAEAFLGRPPVRPCPQAAVTARQHNGLLLFTRNCDGASEQFTVEPASRRLQSYAVLLDGKPAYSCNYSAYKFDQGVLFPLKIDIYHYTYKMAVALDFESLSFESIPEKRFLLVVPPDAQLHSIEDIGEAR